MVEPCFFHANTSLLAHSGDVFPARTDKSICQRIIAVLKVGDVPELSEFKSSVLSRAALCCPIILSIPGSGPFIR